MQRVIAICFSLLTILGGYPVIAQSLVNDQRSQPSGNVSDLGSAVSGLVNGSTESSVSAAVSVSRASDVSLGGEGSFPEASGSSGAAVNSRRTAGEAIGTSRAGLLNQKYRSSAIQALSNSYLRTISTLKRRGSLAKVRTMVGVRQHPLSMGFFELRTTAEEPGQLNVRQASSMNSVAYSEDFPDSTKGTALISPPDTGTESPLDWNPALDFGLEDLSQQTFLNPTLHISRKSRRRRSRPEQGQGAGRNAIPSSMPPSTVLTALPTNPLMTTIPSGLTLQSPLDESLDQP